jgi:peptide chain release factor subunit 1
VELIEKFIETELQPSANSVAIFACAGASNLFETLQLSVPLERHELHIGEYPHLYTLAKMDDEFPRYAALVTDTNSARIFIFGLHTTLQSREIHHPKVHKAHVGGWSQARYQRHVKNFYLHHVKEVLEVLARIVREERIQHVIFAADEVVIPFLREQLPSELADKVIDTVRLEITAPEQEVLNATLESMRRYDAQTDAERVAQILGDYRAGGLATAGVHDVLLALSIGQADEVLVDAAPANVAVEETEPVAKSSVAESAEGPPVDARHDSVADEIVRKAKQTAADVRFIEDPSLLASVGGVAASLRYKV